MTGIATAFQPDAAAAGGTTKVLAVKKFAVGDTIRMGDSGGGSGTATQELCIVKMLVGPGTADITGAPSDTQGIGIQVWLPSTANWNERIRSYGNGSWAGTAETSLTSFSTAGDGVANQIAAANKGYLVTTSDNGTIKKGGGASGASGFMMSNGSINTTLWKDFAERSMHVTAVQAKALALAYYGKKHKYAYFDGFSTGGRQGMKVVQAYPEDYDAVLAGAPAFNWTTFQNAQLYPTIVTIMDTGGTVISNAKGNAVRDAAIASCKPASGMYATLNLVPDTFSCKYDPTRDAAVLCNGVAGRYGVVGTNADATTCVTLNEATAMNKMWYGQTSDGSVPDPAIDNGSGGLLNTTNKQLWFGYERGGVSPLTLAVSSTGNPFANATENAAHILQNPSYGPTNFTNQTGNGMRNWRFLDYSGLATMSSLAISLQDQFSRINTDNADLSAFNARGGKVILYHGLADAGIMPRGTLNYYTRLTQQMGASTVQAFSRFYTIPGLGHSGIVGGAGTGSGTNPLPTSSQGKNEMFEALVAWRERGVAPQEIVVQNGSAAAIQRSVPLCPFPKKVTYNGTGDENVAASYSCK
ncbi:MAG: tannase/feruloyl esterase family alpha/beta hydrolase [Burkholderiales bacterium]|nr:MAG: tannase/feruloyl esterase family alpha/beta hydrolase [Burkholderiales bacterium]